MMNSKDKINENIKSAISDFSLLSSGDTVIVGVSGGADSMALLHFLTTYSEEYDITVVVAHLNHNIRGQEADDDENFVKAYCEKNGIICKTTTKDITAIAKENSMGLEECGRVERYKFFSELAKEHNATKIATGHTLSDRVETLIFNITRGCGLKGLLSIEPKRDNIIRPLINLTREQTESYCKENGIEFVSDSTNKEKDYTRNKIRLDVIPLLKEINPSFEKAVSRLIENAKNANDYMENTAQAVLDKAKGENGLSLSVLKEADRNILPQVIKLFMSEGEYEKKHIDNIIDVINGRENVANIKNNKSIFVDGEFLSVRDNNYENEEKENRVIPFTVYKNRDKNGRVFIVQRISRKDFDENIRNNEKRFKNCIDYDTIPRGSVFRNRLPGDKYKSLGNTITKKLKDFFNERKLTQVEKDNLLILAFDSDAFWIEGFGVSDDAKVTEKTKKIISITFLEED